MTQVQIINRIQTDFGMVPRALWQMDISAHAKLCASYLFCLRDGSAPYVAQIETETGLGRDARRKAFAVLEAKGIIRWVIERDSARRIVAKSLVVDYTPVLASAHAPESQAHGSHAPENPADGKPVPAAVETRPCGDGKSGDTFRKEKQRARRRAARPCEGPSATVALGAVPSRVEFGKRQYQGPDGGWYKRPDCPDDAKAFDAWLIAGQKSNAARPSGRVGAEKQRA
ncbi:MAG: hypothetical protein LC676_08390 [Loktanella sp.]|nr:hypothetical protein [Loktanella sp.]